VGQIVRAILGLGGALALALPGAAHAGAQIYEPLAASVQAALHKSVSDHAVPFLAFDTEVEARRWLAAMSGRLAKRMPDRLQREEFLVTVHYEAKRAGLDPQLVLGLIQVESNFRKYAVSIAGARGFMQVMPFWRKLIGNGEDNLFHLRINLRYGCVILRHYLDIEKGDLYRALGRYNGSLGKPEYPTMVERAWKRDWQYTTHVTNRAGGPSS
jgi:soluble lytic murein transglycosylase-like protein